MPAPTNSVTFSSLSNQTISAILASMYAEQLADRNALPNHPVIQAGYKGDIRQRGSNAIKVPIVGMRGYDILATGTEGVAPTDTAITDTAVTVTVAEKVKIYEATDISRIVDAYNEFSLENLATDAIVSGAATLLSMACNVIDDYSAQAGTTGVKGTFAMYLDAIATLEIAKAMGPYLYIGYPKQWAEIRKDVAASSGGAIQWNPGSQRIIDGMKGLGMQGEFCGVTVFTSTFCPTANTGADRTGGMMAPGGLFWADGSYVSDGDPNQVVIGEKTLFERVVGARNAGITGFKSSRMLGVSKGIEAAGVTLISKA